ncbi:MAG TPA: GNAT family N-acetyltransferase [Methanobacteriaceae archaeon]|nr:GNAT family N-acetyltransferase [Methanobacteriaceae archaeon]
MKFEKLDIKKHSPNKVAELIYETDQSIFNFFYGNKATAAKYLEKLVRVGGNNLGYEHINVATNDDEVMGILLYSWGEGHHKLGELKVLFRNLDFLDAVRFLIIDLKDNLILSHLQKGDFYLAGVAVDEEVRGKGIGGLILEEAIKMARERECKRVVLDVALDNPGAKRLYERIGFEVFNKKSFPWFGKRIGMFNMELKI